MHPCQGSFGTIQSKIGTDSTYSGKVAILGALARRWVDSWHSRQARLLSELPVIVCLKGMRGLRFIFILQISLFNIKASIVPKHIKK